MKAAFHYLVKAKLNLYKNANEINFLEFNEQFENDNPISAREEAFNFYQNYIDVLLQAKGTIYYSDNQARKEIRTFVDLNTSAKIKFGDREIEYGDTLGIGIGIYFVPATPEVGKFIGVSDVEKKLSVITGISPNEFLIHGIENFLGKTDTDIIISNLQDELDCYEKFNFDTKNKEIVVIYCSRAEWEEGYRENEPFTYSILETPFDWSDYDKPYWWGKPNDEISEVQETIQSIEEIIAGGEGNQVEFKPTLLYNFKTKQGGIGIKAIIAKTLCAFLNSNGGFLFIGLDDNGQPQGLDFDFSLANGKKSKDFFKLEFDQTIGHFIGFSVTPLIEADFHEIEGKTIFVVKVEPSNRPVFLKVQDNSKQFFIRANASTRQLNDIEEMLNYMIDKKS